MTLHSLLCRLIQLVMGFRFEKCVYIWNQSSEIMIDDNFIMNHSLLECLREFKGASTGNSAQEREDSLKEPFTLLAKKILYGGYFAVGDSNKEEAYKVEIDSIEFYYHEEENYNQKYRILDPIVYHKNTSNNKNQKKAFQTGTLNAHVSGIDITFEDQVDARYRASALIRTFTVFKDGQEIKEEHPTRMYDYLFMQIPLPELRIKWVEKTIDKQCTLYTGKRINVYQYDENGQKLDGKKGREKKPDERAWRFSKDPL